MRRWCAASFLCTNDLVCVATLLRLACINSVVLCCVGESEVGRPMGACALLHVCGERKPPADGRIDEVAAQLCSKLLCRPRVTFQAPAHVRGTRRPQGRLHLVGNGGV